jgi:flavin reductase
MIDKPTPIVSPPFAIDSALFREAMSRIAAATHLVTTDGAAGKAGLTATAFAPVSDAPPSLLVCLNRESRTAAMIRENGVFAVNTLAAGHQEIANVFAGRTHLHGLRRFDHGKWEAGALGLPVLSDALISFAMRVSGISSIGTHEVVIGAVVDIRLDRAHAGLVYARRAFHAV